MERFVSIADPNEIESNIALCESMTVDTVNATYIERGIAFEAGDGVIYAVVTEK